ncbi:MAG: type I polyketide synthase [Chloroflexi bacterium]|nr:type I polyketide synthase [Chloroflexota bacterium]
MTDQSRSANDREQLERALLALRRVRSRLDELERARSEPIAIVGIGCRFPGGVYGPDAFWDLLRDGRDAISEVPADRWPIDSTHADDPNVPGKIPSRYGGFLDDIAGFDPHFFGISPREARAMDPQQRLLLEAAWEALEDAGCVPSRLAGSPTGVFIGIGLNDYGKLQVVDQTLCPELIDIYVTSGNAFCIAANRLSYTLDLRGPSMAIDTACSSSLVAVHQAVRSLRNGECSLALAGGANVILGPSTSISLAKFLAPDGRCKFGDARADGYVRAEGAAVVTLKPLARAQADGNRIYAVIRGSATNQDGYSSGLTVPNGVAQQALISQALADAQVEPHRISYVEAHGTGTRLGDPIELHAISAALGAGRAAGDICAVGSVKTNVGHLEAAAGIAGLIKLALSLHHGELPASLHYAEPNPEIPYERLGLRVQDRLTPWTSDDGTRLAGVSSFGFGGANAHVILESYSPGLAEPAALPLTPSRQLLTLSARDEQALKAQAQQFAAFVAAADPAALGDICHTTNAGRTSFERRLAVVAEMPAEMADRLLRFSHGDGAASDTGLVMGNGVSRAAPSVAFLFTGQGSQYAGMGRQLYESQSVFRDAVDRCAVLLDPLLERPIRDVLFADGGAAALVDRTAYTQPALFTLEYALAELWRSWGIVPAAVLGHSIGEYVAACVAGVVSLEDAARLVAARGRLMQALPAGGAMAAVFASEAHVSAVLSGYEDRLSIAAINEPGQVVISGESSALDAVLEQLLAGAVKHRRLTVSHAFHSPLMEPMLQEFGNVAESIAYRPPEIPLVSNVTGQLWPAGEAPTAEYWQRQVREAVRFADGVVALHRAGHQLFLEIGPTPALSAAAARSLPEGEAQSVPSLRRGADDWQALLESLAALYVRGVDVDWSGFSRPYGYRPVRVPTYPFQRQRCWYESAEQAARPASLPVVAQGGAHPLLGRRIDSPIVDGAIFETQISPSWPVFLDEHRLHGVPVVPAAAYIEQAAAAAHDLFGAGPLQMEHILIQEALELGSGVPQRVQVIVRAASDEMVTFEVFSAAPPPADSQSAKGNWRLHASGRLRRELATSHPSEGETSAAPSIAAGEAACPESLNLDAFYRRVERQGMAYGHRFRGLRELRHGDRQAVGLVVLPAHVDDADCYQIHPVLLDACLQTFVAALPSGEDEAEKPIFVPVSIERFTITARPGREVRVYVRLEHHDDRAGMLVGDLWVYDADGRLCVHALGVHFKRASREALERLARRAGSDQHAQTDWFYEINWKPAASILPDRADTLTEGGRWLVFTDRQGVGDLLARRLEARGASVVQVSAGSALAQHGQRSWTVDPGNPSHLVTLLCAAKEDAEPWRGIIQCWGLDPRTGPDGLAAGASSHVEVQAPACQSTLHIAQALAGHLGTRLWLVTSGAQAVNDGVEIAVDQAPLWGLSRTILRERPETRATAVDLDPADPMGSVDALLAELLADGDEREIALRAGQRLCPRLRPRRTLSDTQPVYLDAPRRGVLDHLTLLPLARRAPGSGEVEIEVRASGLNFRDVLAVLDLYPGGVDRLGNECAGVVVRVGAAVTGPRVGDEVIAVAEGSHRSFVLADARLSVPKPAELSFEEAATLPIAYLTAWYGLRTLARLKSGERVLIHAATGGVGLAAVRLAQQLGAEVFATAGSVEKRAHLQHLGVRHIFNSRTTDFYGEVMTATGGEGVDVVLNSLTDELLARSIDCVAARGRFVEIGRRGIWTPESVAARRPDIAYLPFLLGEVCQRDPEMIGAALREIVDQVGQRTLAPLPLRAFRFAQARQAFHQMAQARHIGKLVLCADASRGRQHPAAARGDGAYLITGGLGGIGLAAARSLAEQGAGLIALVGRRTPSEHAAKEIAALQNAGSRVLVCQADVAALDQLAEVFALIDQTGLPLRGVIHAAGVLDDGVLQEQTWERFAQVLAPKLSGTVNLHTFTRERDLDFFVLCSAGAALTGAAGQSSYVAANAFLDGFAHWRQRQGLPALSINWGPWAETGMTASLRSQDRQRLSDAGLLSFSTADGLAALEQSLTLDVPQIAALPLNQRALSELAAHGGVPTLFQDLAQSNPAQESKAMPPGVQQRIADAPPSQRRSLVQVFVREHVGRVMNFDPSLIVDPTRPLSELGLDSLMAVELRNSLAAGLGLALSPTLLFECPTIDALVGHLLTDHLDGAAELPKTPSSADASARTKAVHELAQLSDQEAEQVLLAELGLAG